VCNKGLFASSFYLNHLPIFLSMKKSIILTLLMLSTGFATTIFATKPTPEQADKPRFEDLLNEFPKGTLPYTLSADALKQEFVQERGVERSKAQQIIPKKRIQNHLLLPDMPRFSRMPAMPEAVMALESKTHYVLIYTRGRYLGGYQAAIYDKKGRLFYNMEVAHANQDEIKSFSLDENLNATFTMYELKWKKNVETAGYAGNKIKSMTLQKTNVVDMTVLPKSEEKEPQAPKLPIPDKKAPAEIKKQPAIIRA
jgi:hypothetical protein